MIGLALQIWRRTLANPSSWAAIVWGFLVLVVLVLIASALTGNLVALIREAGSASAVVHAHFLAILVDAAVLELLFILLLFPFWLGGALGSWGAQIAGEPENLTRFWPAARASYGRGWGVLLYVALFGVAALTAYVMLRIVLPPVRAELLMMVGIVLALPWVVRLLGGLFVRRRGWIRSAARSIRGGRYPGMLGGALMAAATETILFLAALELERVSLAAGAILYVLVLAVLSVAVPVWYLSLYEAEQRLAPPDEEEEAPF